jgi:SAM-dependent methyltransferase
MSRQGTNRPAVGTTNETTRTSWVAQCLREMPTGWRILDAGAGEQKYRPYCAHLSYVAQDFAQYDGVGDARGLQTGRWDQSGLDIVSDITTIPAADASFDAIMCVEVFEHLPDPLAALGEFRRLLKVGGQLLLTAPFCSLTHFAPYHFYSGFNRYFYQRHLPELGFEILKLEANGNFFEYLAQEVLRLPVMAEKYAGTGVSRWQKFVMHVMLLWLRSLSGKDAGSSDLLCYGYHVLARKVDSR